MSYTPNNEFGNIPLTGVLIPCITEGFVAESQYIKGGYIVVKTIEERDALLSNPLYEDRELPVGTPVFVSDENKTYRYVGEPAIWVENTADLETVNGQINDLQQGDPQSFELLFKIEDVASYNVSIVDEKQEGEEIDLLPNDLNRLSSNISKLLEILNSNIKDLQKVVKMQIDTDNGNVPKNITPYQYIIKAYINNKPELISNLSKRTNNKKNIFQIAIVEDLDIDESIISDLKKKKILKDYRNYKID